MPMTVDKKAMGAAIKQVRTARGLTQIDLAKAAGFSKGGKSIAQIEQGKRSVSLESLNSLAEALAVPPACLTILGSRNAGKKNDATEFLESVRDVLENVVAALTELKTGSRRTESVKQTGAQRKHRTTMLGMAPIKRKGTKAIRLQPPLHRRAKKTAGKRVVATQ